MINSLNWCNQRPSKAITSLVHVRRFQRQDPVNPVRVPKVLNEVIAAEIPKAFWDRTSIGALYLNLFNGRVWLAGWHEEGIEEGECTCLNAALVCKDHIDMRDQKYENGDRKT